MAKGVASLNYLALLRSLFGSTLFSPTVDSLYRYLMHRGTNTCSDKTVPTSEKKEQTSDNKGSRSIDYL